MSPLLEVAERISIATHDMFSAKDCIVVGIVTLDLNGDTYRGWQSMPSATPWSSVVATEGGGGVGDSK